MIINQDILEWCKTYEGPKFHAVLCDPPYELGFMGKSWDSTGVAFDQKTWKAIANQCYPGAYLLAFGGTRTFHRIAVAIEDAGFEIRDTVMWVYSTGFPKSHDVSKAIDKNAGHWRGKAGAVVSENVAMTAANYERTDKGEPITADRQRWNGYGTALKPSWEPVIIARLPLEGTVAQNAQEYGSGALNIDGSRVGTEGEETHAGGFQQDGMVGGKAIKRVEQDLTPRGRWPANLIHDGSDEVVGMFPETTSRKRKQPSNSKNSIWNNSFDNDGVSEYDDSGSAARFFYSAKVSKRERDAGLDSDPKQYSHDGRDKPIENAYQRNDSVARNSHPTLKPISLTTYLAKLILPPKLDQPRRLLVPFAGSGSEVIGGYLAGWDEVLGVEREPEYVKIAEARIKHWTNSSPQSSSSSTFAPQSSMDGQEILDI